MAEQARDVRVRVRYDVEDLARVFARLRRDLAAPEPVSAEVWNDEALAVTADMFWRVYGYVRDTRT